MCTDITGLQGQQGIQGVKGDKGEQGAKGNDGKGIKSTSVTYQIWSNGTSTPTGTWSSTPPKTTADKPYLWTRTVITYTDNAQSTSYSVGSTPEGIQIGGRNLIRGSGIISTDFALGTGDIVSNGYNGNKAVQTTAAWNGPFIHLKEILNRNKITVGTTLTVSIYVSTTSTTEITTPAIYLYRGNGNEQTAAFGSLKLVAGRWVKISKTYKISAALTSISDITRFESSANTSYGILWSSPKLEIGNKATDWTPAPEDVDNAINEERTTRQSAIETKANEITSKVSETYVSNSAFEHYQNTVSSQFTQTKKDFTWSINQSVTDAKNEMNGQIGSVNGRVDGLKETTDNVNNYMSFDKDGLTLGKSDSAFKTKITNQEWSIQKNGAKVTYINDQTMYITDGQFTRSLKIGNFGFVPRANGSLDFKR